ncbi:MAG: winged helix-turn-helix domain-containing protein [Litorilinea sp.]
MPNTLRLSDGGYMRRLDVQGILQTLFNLECVQLIGFSNVGKSSLLRLIAQPDVWMQELGEAGHDFLVVYIDCNRMLNMSVQGFYELVLRCLQESSDTLAVLPELTTAYEMLVAPASEFQIPLAFNRGLTAALESTPRKIVLLLDEFDEPISQIDTRVFINLRALRDRHVHELVYVTATHHSLRHYQTERHATEFAELFSRRAWYLAPLTHSDVERLVHRYADAYEAEFVTADIDFVYQWSGGHPALAEFICNILHRALLRAEDQTPEAVPDTRAETGLNPPAAKSSPANSPAATPTDVTARWELHRQIAQKLRQDEAIAHECAKLWDGCNAVEQAMLRALYGVGLADKSNGSGTPGSGTTGSGTAGQADLLRRYLLVKIEDQVQPFSRLLAEYIQRQVNAEQQTTPDSLWVDIQSGEVLVDGTPVETLTNLEYKLMLLLFQNAEKIVDKYQIVTEVWGESYIDEVDDTRIEKLVSRLRQKIEPDPSSPRFLNTVRGRGYRLSLTNGERPTD